MNQICFAAVVASVLGLIVSNSAAAAAPAYKATLLHPAGSVLSVANAASGTCQVGHVYRPAAASDSHAVVWSGAAESFIDLNPAAFTLSTALAVSGNYQAGYGGGPASGYANHALVWNGTAES